MKKIKAMKFEIEIYPSFIDHRRKQFTIICLGSRDMSKEWLILP